MWLFAMFDLPVKTKSQRKQYARFRKALLELGFSQMQYSVYAKFCSGEERSNALRHQIRRMLPPAGAVRLLAVTDRQFGKMENYLGKIPAGTERAPEQLTLF